MADSLSSRYHAHANGTLLVLLDVTPSQEMVDEGVAREVINKIQKLRKKVIPLIAGTLKGVGTHKSIEELFSLSWNFRPLVWNPIYTQLYRLKLPLEKVGTMVIR